MNESSGLLPGSYITFFVEVVSPLIETRQKSLQEFSEVLLAGGKITEQEKKQNHLYGKGFNPFSQFMINERGHSRLIGNLLDPLYPHGQGNRFLMIFLQKLGIQVPNQGTWNVYIEKARVDILLKRERPHSVVVLENKSNYAIDQPSQLYRYWYEHIYLPNKGDPCIDYKSSVSYDLKDIKARYVMLYLVPSSFKIPSLHSLKQPDWGLPDDSLPKELPIPIRKETYAGLIVQWLEECRGNVPLTNHRLREYLNMYIEFWKLKFV